MGFERGWSCIARLTYENRIRIRELLDVGLSAPEIAREIGVHHSSVYDELKRGGGASSYDQERAQKITQRNREKQNNLPLVAEIFEDQSLAKYVSALMLDDGLNAQQVVRWLQNEEPGRFQRVPKSHNTILAAIDRGLIPGVTRDTLKTKTVRLYSGDLLHVPQWVIRELGLCDGDELSIEVSGDTIILRIEKKG